VLIREEELRFSKEYLEACEKAKNFDKIIELTVELQQKVLKEFGLNENRGLDVLNNARFEFKNDPEMNDLTVYMRQDRSANGNISEKVDETAPDVALLTLQGEPTTLQQYIKSLKSQEPKPSSVFQYFEWYTSSAESFKEPRPIVILSGSLT